MTTLDRKTKQLLRDPHKRRAWVKYQCQLMGISMAQIAAEAGVTRSCFYQVFRAPYPRMERVLADALELSPSELFPERYDEDGLPIYRMGRPKKSISNGSNGNTGNGHSNVNCGAVA